MKLFDLNINMQWMTHRWLVFFPLYWCIVVAAAVFFLFFMFCQSVFWIWAETFILSKKQRKLENDCFANCFGKLEPICDWDLISRIVIWNTRVYFSFFKISIVDEFVMQKSVYLFLWMDISFWVNEKYVLLQCCRC